MWLYSHNKYDGSQASDFEGWISARNNRRSEHDFSYLELDDDFLNDQIYRAPPVFFEGLGQGLQQ